MEDEECQRKMERKEAQEVLCLSRRHHAKVKILLSSVSLDTRNRFQATFINDSSRCRETGKHVKCPNGDNVDWNLGGAEELAGCRIEDW